MVRPANSRNVTAGVDCAVALGRRLLTPLAAAIAAMAAVPAPALALRAMTWNIAGSPFNTRATTKPPLPFALGDVEAVIARNAPDVLALQEACSWQSAALGRDLGLVVWHEVAIARFTDTRPGSPGTCDYGDALLGRTDPTQRVRVDLLDRAHCKSDATVVSKPPLPECRLLIGADFAGVYGATTHVGIDPSQSAQLGLIVDAAAAVPGPSLLMGDMNVLPQDPRLAPRLAARGYREVTGTVPGLPCSAAPSCRQTFPSGGPFGRPVARPDMIFARGLASGARQGPADVMVGGRPASDHRPLVADLEPAPSGGAIAILPRRLRNVSRRGPSVVLGLLQAGHVRAKLLASPATARALRLRTRTLATADVTASGAGALRLSLRPVPRARRALAAARRATLTVNVRVDAVALPPTTFVVRP
jgi:endonuclease/exonuclease/phosphatase family metal-dependent hydrolase